MGRQIKSPIGAGWSLPFNFVNREDIFMMCVIESFHSTVENPLQAYDDF